MQKYTTTSDFFIRENSVHSEKGCKFFSYFDELFLFVYTSGFYHQSIS
jgi:hypothetical protein